MGRTGGGGEGDGDAEKVSTKKTRACTGKHAIQVAADSELQPPPNQPNESNNSDKKGFPIRYSSAQYTAVSLYL